MSIVYKSMLRCPHFIEILERDYSVLIKRRKLFFKPNFKMAFPFLKIVHFKQISVLPGR